MNTFWHKIMHRRRDGLVKTLAQSTDAKKLETYLDKSDPLMPAQLLHESSKILSRTRALTDPHQREHVAEVLRASLVQRAPKNLAPMEGLLRVSGMHVLCEKILRITFAGPGFTTAMSTRIEAVKTPDSASALRDTIACCEKLEKIVEDKNAEQRQTGEKFTPIKAIDLIEQMTNFFEQPYGARWLAALGAALDAALAAGVIAPDKMSRPATTHLQRLLAPFVTSLRISPRVCRAAARKLHAGDVETIVLFHSFDCVGPTWLHLMSELLIDMRRPLQQRHRSRAASRV